MTDDTLSIGEALYRIHAKSTLEITAQQGELSAQLGSLAKLLQDQVQQIRELRNAEDARSNEFSKLISDMRDVAMSKELQENISEHIKADIWGALTALLAQERSEYSDFQRKERLEYSEFQRKERLEYSEFQWKERLEYSKLQRQFAQANGVEIARAIDELRDAVSGAPSLPLLPEDATLLARIKAFPDIAFTWAMRLFLDLQPLLVATVCLLVLVLVRREINR